jgi:hypothetical protein
MSVDFNSIITNAINEAQKRRNSAASVTQGIVNADAMGESGRSSELSMEDIATAMKAKSSQKHSDTDFITNHGKAFKVTHDEDDKTPGVAANVTAKIHAISESSEQHVNRKSEIAQSLQTYRKPYN